MMLPAAAAENLTPSSTGLGSFTVTVPGTTHKLGTANLSVELYDNQIPAWHVEPDHIVINPSTFDVTVFLQTPQSGRVVIR